MSDISKDFTWQQKWQAIQVASSPKCRCELIMRRPGDWYVSTGMSIADTEWVQAHPYGEGETPEEAVNNHWNIYSKEPWTIDGATWVEWSGFMWTETTRPNPNPLLEINWPEVSP